MYLLERIRLRRFVGKVKSFTTNFRGKRKMKYKKARDLSSPACCPVVKVQVLAILIGQLKQKNPRSLIFKSGWLSSFYTMF